MNDHHPQPDLALAAWIRAARRGAGLSQAELAEQLGLGGWCETAIEIGVAERSSVLPPAG